MTLELDQESRELRYKGKKVGSWRVENGIAHVSINLEYESAPEDWVVPISWLSNGLAQVDGAVPSAVLELHSNDDDIAKEYLALRLLTEKWIRRDGYIWKFHKTDKDTWPSDLHGHDYDKHLKLDAITGNIFDVATRELCKTLKPDSLIAIQSALRDSKDFREKVALLIDQPRGRA